METEFIDYEEDDTTALLLNHNNQKTLFNNDKQTKEAKKYLKKLDTNLESLKSQNQELINNVVNKSANDQLIAIPNLSFSIENSVQSNSNRTGFFSMRNNFNTPDILFMAVFFMILLPIVIIIYRYYFYENEHNIPHDHPH